MISNRILISFERMTYSRETRFLVSDLNSQSLEVITPILTTAKKPEQTENQ
uniref:Macaca fascicularis brain cDNA clone: QflA-17206, similar to human claudin 11 (oligodendrocyte transmembrane protein)(CLDN11), mRNA, RefSeq: NM_005602.4 n=1 Tax=Macaca fascicularis TaxID=9541 RepID=I7GMJ6_MACFA|nr:unnamed protein product [Macaca fascicularis]